MWFGQNNNLTTHQNNNNNLTNLCDLIWQTYFAYFAETEKLLLKEL